MPFLCQRLISYWSYVFLQLPRRLVRIPTSRDTDPQGEASIDQYEKMIVFYCQDIGEPNLIRAIEEAVAPVLFGCLVTEDGQSEDAEN